MIKFRKSSKLYKQWKYNDSTIIGSPVKSIYIITVIMDLLQNCDITR